MELGQAIRERRQELRLTQQQLASMSGVSVRLLKSIEANGANPTVQNVEKLLHSLGLRLLVVDSDRLS